MSALIQMVKMMLGGMFVAKTTIVKCRQEASESQSPTEFTSDEVKREISVAATANNSAVMDHEKASVEMRKSGDALASLARGFQRRP